MAVRVTTVERFSLFSDIRVVVSCRLFRFVCPVIEVTLGSRQGIFMKRVSFYLSGHVAGKILSSGPS